MKEEQGDIFPLYLASQEGKLEHVKLLIEGGADVNLQLHEVSPPLFFFSSFFSLLFFLSLFKFIGKYRMGILHLEMLVQMAMLTLFSTFSRKDLLSTTNPMFFLF